MNVVAVNPVYTFFSVLVVTLALRTMLSVRDAPSSGHNSFFRQLRVLMSLLSLLACFLGCLMVSSIVLLDDGDHTLHAAITNFCRVTVEDFVET